MATTSAHVFRSFGVVLLTAGVALAVSAAPALADTSNAPQTCGFAASRAEAPSAETEDPFQAATGTLPVSSPLSSPTVTAPQCG
jgi:hypothetical protein